jgi:hypothetical protein
MQTINNPMKRGISKLGNSNFYFENIFKIPKSKRSQITVFIILAILIVVLIGVFFSYRMNLLNLNSDVVNPDIAPIHSFVVSCIKQAGEDGIYNIGQTGGYFNSPNLSTDNQISYYLYGNDNLMPSKEKIENELSEYMNNMLFFCTKNFIDFPDFNVKQGEIKTKTTIEDNKVIFNVNYPLSIKKNDKSYLFNQFKDIEIPVRLGVIYGVNQLIMEDQMKNKKDVCASCLNQWANEKDLYIDMYDYKKSLVFVITDTNSRINEKEFTFYFANKYEN